MNLLGTEKRLLSSAQYEALYFCCFKIVKSWCRDEILSHVDLCMQIEGLNWLEQSIVRYACNSRQNTLVRICLETRVCQKLVVTQLAWIIAMLSEPNPRPTNPHAAHWILHDGNDWAAKPLCQ